MKTFLGRIQHGFVLLRSVLVWIAQHEFHETFDYTYARAGIVTAIGLNDIGFVKFSSSTPYHEHSTLLLDLRNLDATLTEVAPMRLTSAGIVGA